MTDMTGTPETLRDENSASNMIAVAAGLKWLIGAPVVAGIITFAGLSLLPRQYVSVATVTSDATTIGQIDGYFHLPAVRSAIAQAAINQQEPLAFYLGDPISRARVTKILPTAATIEYVDTSPQRAVDGLSAILKAYAEASKPIATPRANVPETRARLTTQLDIVNGMLSQLTTLSAAPSIMVLRETLAMHEQRWALIDKIANLDQSEQTGTVISDPSRPSEPARSHRAWISGLVAAFAGIFALFVILTNNKIREWRNDPAMAKRLDHFANAIRRGKK